MHNLYAPLVTRESRSDDRRMRFPFVSFALHNDTDSGRPIRIIGEVKCITLDQVDRQNQFELGDNST